MNRKETATKTMEIFKNIFGEIPDLDEDTTSEEVDKWDSLNHIIFLQKLEEEFGIKFNLFEIIELRSIGSIINYISSIKQQK